MSDRATLAEAARARRDAEELYRLAIDDARQNGLSLQAIADALGVTRQAVWESIRARAAPTEEQMLRSGHTVRLHAAGGRYHAVCSCGWRARSRQEHRAQEQGREHVKEWRAKRAATRTEENHA